MKAYEALTSVGIKRRLSKVVEIALREYEIDVLKVNFLDEATNMFYKVTAKNGDLFAAKVVMDEWIKEEDNKIEAFLLETIKSKTDIQVPTLICNKENEKITIVDSELTPSPKRILIYKWFDGIDIDGNETAEWFYKIGRITAKLHDALDGVELPGDIRAKKWDQVFYFRGEEAVYKNKNYQSFLSAEYHQVMDRMISYLNIELPKIYHTYDSFVIHGDLNPWNIKIQGDTLTVFDFEDNIRGTALHDFAIMLFYYWYDENYNFEEVKMNFLNGYKSIRRLPEFTEFELELLMTARRVNFLNYILQVSENPTNYIEKNLPRVIAFEKKYKL